MKYLKKLYLHLTKFFQKDKRTSNNPNIPDEIADDEIIVRGIVHPLFFSYSKKKLKPESFLPPPFHGRKDVSVLRHNYTDSNHCKRHIKEKVVINNNDYAGLAILQAKLIEEINLTNVLTFDNGERLTVSLMASPIENLLMHSDILYSHGVVENEPNTLMRKLAKSIKDKSKYLHDPNPKELDWNGDSINQELFQ